ncbi:MAG: NAD-dependent epimerase [Bacillota bacterium]
MANILVTGAAGFIGFHLTQRLLSRGDTVIGIDNLNDYYEVGLKKARLSKIEEHSNFHFEYCNIADYSNIKDIFDKYQIDRVCNLAAQAGVRYSIKNPHVYVESNLVGFINVLEACRHHGIKHLVFASSSSVYGANTLLPFSIHHNVDHPVSLYAATKKANELMAHTYAKLYGLPCTGLRFFTVYGPWGRPDMALFKFTKAILNGEPIEVYNYGKMKRDFTYIDDIVEGVVRVIDKTAEPNPDWDGNKPDPGTSNAPYRIYNIGNNNPVDLMYFIETLERTLGKTTKKELLPLQDGDVVATFADVDDLVSDMGFKPSTDIELGIKRFVDWYRNYYKV